jgi:clan AA aspartic protease (TIGR02281 family)
VLLALVVPASAQQSRRDIMPVLGETREQFEARRRGLPPPASPGETRLSPDRLGHFLAEATQWHGAANARRHRRKLRLAQRQGRRAPRPASGRARLHYRVSTANGVVKAALVRLREMQVGDVSLRDVQALVPEASGGPPMSLLGMSFLKRLAGFETIQGKLILRQ